MLAADGRALTACVALWMVAELRPESTAPALLLLLLLLLRMRKLWKVGVRAACFVGGPAIPHVQWCWGVRQFCAF